MPTPIAMQVSQDKQRYVEEWRVLETYRGERHLVGRFSSTGKYWATPPIVRWDFTSRAVLTGDGRNYLLVGEPGALSAAERFITLCAVFDERLLTTEDVTAEFLSHEGTSWRSGVKLTRSVVSLLSPRNTRPSR